MFLQVRGINESYSCVMMVNQNKMKEDDLLNDKTVTVYWGEGCQPCNATKWWLDKKGIEYEAIQVTPENKDELGIMSVPVVKIAESKESGGRILDTWTGFRPDRLAGELL